MMILGRYFGIEERGNLDKRIPSKYRFEACSRQFLRNVLLRQEDSPSRIGSAIFYSAQNLKFSATLKQHGRDRQIFMPPSTARNT
jgi:hypothetical protein